MQYAVLKMSIWAVLSCLSVFAPALRAQSLAKYKVTYFADHRLCEWVQPYKKYNEGSNTLYFNEEASIFFHDNYPKERIITKPEESAGSVVYIGVLEDPEQRAIYINLRDKYLYYKTLKAANGNPKSHPIVREDLPDIKWKIFPEHRKKIGDFQCVRAEGRFGDRLYSVWFTPDIPLGFGPHKLCGLPGLILSARSLDGVVNFEFQSFSASFPEQVIVEEPKVGKKMTREEFEAHVIAYYLRYQEYRIEHPGTGDLEDAPCDCTIERCKDHIYTEYKQRQKGRNKR